MLKDAKFKMSYSSGYDAPKSFFTEALIESKQFDLGLGFFSSSGIRSLAYGFAMFIANGGSMRVIINHILSEDDKAAIQTGTQLGNIDFEAKIISNFDRLTSVLSKADEHFFKCLSYLISINRIEFIATVSPMGGIGHDKYGIFTDGLGDKVAFIGSANFSSSALELNGETITVFTSNRDKDRVDWHQNLFNDTWSGSNDHLIHIPINNIKTHIKGKFKSDTLNELLQEGVNLREIENIRQDIENKTLPHMDNLLPKELLEKIRMKEMEPRFPFPEERQIQIDAYNAWIDNGKKGIFAMATGTGKTVTALNCVLKEYKNNGYYRAIIVVPTKALAKQWEHEAAAFNFQNIISTQTTPDWWSTLQRYTTQSLLPTNDPRNIILITTYATFNRERVQNFINKTRNISSFIYIADEAHNLGSPSSLRHLPNKISNRIGLSATPERVYDEYGSKETYDFFNSAPPAYTYRYTMKQAIWQEPQILCHYEYYPIFVKLTTEEMAEYARITNDLRKFIDPDTNTYRKPDADNLLLKRKRVIHKATNKKQTLISLLDSLGGNRLEYAFVFVPEGYEPDYSDVDTYEIQDEDERIIREYAEIFRDRNYTYHNYIFGIEDAETVLRNFADGRIKVLLSMKCLDEGVDIPRAEYAIFCASTGNPRQFVQRRGRVLRKCDGKNLAKIWDFIVVPPEVSDASKTIERNMFRGEVARIVNFAVLADNREDLLNGELMNLCERLEIPLSEIVEKEENQYNPL